MCKHSYPAGGGGSSPVTAIQRDQSPVTAIQRGQISGHNYPTGLDLQSQLANGARSSITAIQRGQISGHSYPTGPDLRSQLSNGARSPVTAIQRGQISGSLSEATCSSLYWVREQQRLIRVRTVSSLPLQVAYVISTLFTRIDSNVNKVFGLLVGGYSAVVAGHLGRRTTKLTK